MKKLLLGAVALLAIAAPGVASAQTGGYVGTGFATLDEGGDPDKESVWGYGGGVTTHVGGWRIGADGTALTMDHSNHDDGFSLVQGHVGYDFGNFTLGGVVGRLSRGSDYNIMGIEGGLDLGRFDLGASYSSGERLVGSGDISNWTVAGSFNLTDRFSIGATFSESDFDFGLDAESYSVGVNYAFENGLVIGGGYRSTDFLTTDTTGFNLTLSWRFGDQVDMMPGARELMYDSVAVQ